ncbi:Transposase-like protein [Acinetobacter baumannii]|nr:Transposase-like protein [Acinetobacter baumannii]
MVLDALEQALHDRGMPKNVIHHSDRGVQYLSIRYTNRLEEQIYEHQSVQRVIHTIMLWLKR